jgi:methylisocitrate lyase
MTCSPTCRRITDVCALPLLVDVDTGFGGAFNIARTVKSLIKFGAGAMHIEDQVQAKRCGIARTRKSFRAEEMVDRIKAAADARTDPDFVIMAAPTRWRSKAWRPRSIARRLRRSGRRHDLSRGDDRARDVSQVRRRSEGTGAGEHHRIRQDAAVHVRELRAADVSLVLYPLSAFRAMNQAALRVYEAIGATARRRTWSIDADRARLYDYLDYHAYERKLDRLFAKETNMMSNEGHRDTRTQAQEVGCAVRRPGRQHRSVHGRAAGNDLHYRGYDILDFAENARVRGVAYLLVHGKLPTAASSRLQAEAQGDARLPAACRTSGMHSRQHASDGRAAHRCSALGSVLPGTTSTRVAEARNVADRMMAASARCCCTGTTSRTRAGASTWRPTTTRSAAISCTCCTARPSELWVRAMHTSLILYAEHEFNASTFTRA